MQFEIDGDQYEVTSKTVIVQVPHRERATAIIFLPWVTHIDEEEVVSQLQDLHAYRIFDNINEAIAHYSNPRKGHQVFTIQIELDKLQEDLNTSHTLPSNRV